MIRPSTNQASAIVFIAASIWGLYWLPLRTMDAMGVHGGWAVWMMNFPAAVVLGVVTLWQWRAHRGHWGPALAVGLFTGLGLACYATGLVLSSVVRVTLLFYLTPIWATLIGMVWLGERATWARWAAIAGGLGGLIMMVSGGMSEGPGLNAGDAMALASGVFWAIGAAVIVRYDDVPIAGMTAVQFAVSSVAGLGLGLLASGLAMPAASEILNASPIAVGVSVGIVMPAVALIFWAQKFLFPGRAGLLMMSEVLVAVISAAFLLPEEVMSSREWAGAILILCACFIEVSFSPAEPEKA